jgi:polyphosphate kinase 2 (PPK2 family)
MQRYLAHFPAAGEVVIFDRSWYNRAGVEYVMDFAAKGPSQLSRRLARNLRKTASQGTALS